MPTAMMMVEGTMGSKVEGLATFGDSLCSVMNFKTPPVWTQTMVGLLGFGIDPSKGYIISRCENPALLESLGDITQKMSSGSTLSLSEATKNSLSSASKLLKNLPKLMPPGFALSISVKTKKTGLVGKFTKLMKLGDVKFDFQFSADMAGAGFKAAVSFDELDLKIGGPVKECWILPTVEASWKPFQTPNIGIRGSLGMKVKIGKSNFLYFQGSFLYGTQLEAEMDLKQPTLLPLISPRIALVRTPDFPTKMAVSLSVSSDLAISFSGGVVLNARENIPMMSGVADGLNYVKRCNGLSYCYSLQYGFSLNMNILTLIVRDATVKIRAAPADIILEDIIAAVTGLPLGSASAAIKQIMPVRPKILALTFQVGIVTKVRLGLVAQFPVFNAWLMVNLDFQLQAPKRPNIKFSVIMNSFCLGINSGGCYGIQLEKTPLGQNAWRTIKSDVATTWGGSWTDSLLPGPMRYGTNMGPFAIMELMPNARFRMQATGKMSVGRSYGFLPSVSITTDISPSRVYIAASMRYYGVVLNFNLDMRFRGAKPYIQTFKLTMDFSKLFDAIKAGARAVLGHSLYKLANLVGIFNSFWIGKASFAMTEHSISLAVDMKIYFNINLRLNINTQALSDIFNGKFLSVARSALNNMLRSLRNWSPCDCKSGYKAPWQRTWGAYSKRHAGRHVVPCGVSTSWRRSCGHNWYCGINVRWCSGRRRGWAGPNYPCGKSYKWCCKSFPSVSTRYCSYTLPAVGYHPAQRRRYCDTRSFCPSNLFRKWKFR